MPYFRSIAKKWLSTGLFKASLISLLILGLPVYAHASIYTENFDSFSAGSFQNPQHDFTIVNDSAYYTTTIDNNIYNSSPNSIKFVNTGNPASFSYWKVATTSAPYTVQAVSGRIYIPISPNSSDDCRITGDLGSPYDYMWFGTTYIGGNDHISFCLDGAIQVRYKEVGGYSASAWYPWGTGNNTIWNQGWNTFYLLEDSSSTFGISINGSDMQYAPSRYAGMTFDGTVAFYTGSYGNGTTVYYDDLTMYTINAPEESPYENVSTRITSVSPYDGQPVSTTSPITLEASGYVSSSVSDLTDVDNTDGLQVKWLLYSISNPNCLPETVFPSLTAGVCGISEVYTSGTGYGVFGSQWFNVSTSTGVNLETGYYTLKTSIIMPNEIFGFTNLFGIIDFGINEIVSTTTSFYAGSPTSAQTALNDLFNASRNGILGLTATSSEVSLSSCNPFSLDLGMCLGVLFLPSLADMQNLLQFAHDNFLNRAPWGYATRMVSILTNNATTTASTALPTWVVTFPSIQGTSGSPLAGTIITFDMQDMLDTGSTTLNGIIDPVSGKTMREIIEPYILLFIAISALIIVFHDIMGMGKHTNNYADK